MSSAIDVSDIGFSYGEVRAVDGVSFSIPAGKILGFLGPNGAGKSTTIKMLTGQLRPEGGTIEILGVNMPARREDIQARMGVCFEEKNLYTSMTARENLQFFAKLFEIENFDAEPLLTRVGLQSRMNDRVSEYSKGMRQRLMMARAFINTPDVLLLDEPTDGLDPVSAITVRNLIRDDAEFRNSSKLLYWLFQEADTLSDEVAFINQGKILTLDTPDHLKMEHGRRTVRIRAESGDGVREQVISLDEEASGDRIRAAVSANGVQTIHTEEATLEDIFVKFAGRGLAG